MATAITIDVVSDYVCPWCYIGKRRLEAALAERSDIEINVRWLPFQLNPDMPKEGKDRREHMVSIFGAERAQSMMDNIGQLGADDGLVFGYKEGSKSPNTLSAHVLSQRALLEDKQDVVSELLFKAHFTDCENIGDQSVLLALAKNAGLTLEGLAAEITEGSGEVNVQALIEQARSQGVSGVPFFIIDGQYGLSGAQPVDALVAAIDQVLKEKVA
ncbi:DsbA family oxidoreductase [bacterium]|nr:DsbA family oxidoreductase [bacterium]